MSALGDNKPNTVEHVGTPATGHLGREEDAKLSLENTEVSLRTAWVLIACLLCTILFVPTLQLIHESRTARANDLHQASAVGRFPSFNILRLIPGLREVSGADNATGLDALLPSVKDLRAYEDTLEEQSVVANWILPRTQFLLTDVLGAGNEEVYKGRGNWLFYRPDVDYVTGPGFLTTIGVNERERKLSGRQADPVSAIEDFDRQLRARGIRLIVVPAAAKPTIHPDMMSHRYAWNSQPAQNSSYTEFIGRLRSRGILVFDTTRVLLEARDRERRAQYLPSDTHWTPEAVEGVADGLSDYIAKETALPARRPVDYSTLSAKVSGIGDIAVMLKLPKGTDTPYRSTEDIRQVRLGGNMWKPDKGADILFLGDSFSNIYSLKGMGWGESAGLVEQLSYRLRRPIDRITINAGGAYATRDALRRQLARDPNRLAGKRVVVYEFAERELASGDWKILSLTSAGTVKGRSVAERPAASAVPAKSLVPSPTPEQQVAPSAPAPVAIPNAKPATAGLPVPAPKPIASGGKLTAAKHRQTAEPRGAGAPVTGTGQAKTGGGPRPADSQFVIEATVAGKAAVPAPGTVPYADCVIAVHLKSIKVLYGKITAKEIVVFLWGMRQNKLTPAAAYSIGQRVTLKLKPWEAAEPTYGSYNRVELEDDDLLMLDVFWGEETK